MFVYKFLFTSRDGIKREGKVMVFFDDELNLWKVMSPNFRGYMITYRFVDDNPDLNDVENVARVAALELIEKIRVDEGLVDVNFLG